MFGKIFSSMFTGSMVGSGAVTFAVWSYVIANMEPGDDGKMWVELNPALLAGILGEPLEEVMEVVEGFCQPDPDSRSKEEGGRKLMRHGQFLYWVVNGAEYRLARNKEARREYQRKWMADRRSELAAMGVPQKKRVSKRNKPLPGESAAVAAEERGDRNGADAITTAALPVPRGKPLVEVFAEEAKIKGGPAPGGGESLPPYSSPLASPESRSEPDNPARVMEEHEVEPCSPEEEPLGPDGEPLD